MKTNTGTTRTASEPLVVDTRPVFKQGGTPCGAIDDAVRQLKPGQPLVLLVPFEPIPLFAKLGALGFEHDARMESDGTWRAEFRRTGERSSATVEVPKCSCGG